MTSPTVPSNAYTDAPEQHPNLILGSLQLLFWLFFHPSAWRNHIARIDTALRPDFCLAELNRSQWRNAVLRRLLIQGYVVWPILLGLVVALLSWGVVIWWADVMLSVALGVAGGMAFSVLGGVAAGVAFSVAGCVAVSLAGYLVVDVAVLAAACGGAVGVVGNVVGSLAVKTTAYSRTKKIGYFVAAILLGGFSTFLLIIGSGVVPLVLGFGLFLLLQNITFWDSLEPELLKSVLSSVTFGVLVGAVGMSRTDQGLRSLEESETWKVVIVLGVVVLVAVGLALGVALGMTGLVKSGVVGYVAVSVAVGVAGVAFFVIAYVMFTGALFREGGEFQAWKIGIVLGMVVALGLSVAFGVMDLEESGVAVSVAVYVVSAFFVIALVMITGALFGWVYQMFEDTDIDIQGGAIAGVVIGGLWIALLASDPPDEASSVRQVQILSMGLLGLVAGLILPWWRPALLYPLLAAWNTLLFWREKRLIDNHLNLLRYHSAFWDEHQRLPLLGLDEHIVLVAERNPAEGQAAIDYLSTSRQRWAAQAAQIELDARRLERCADVKKIGQAHRKLAAGELESPASSLFRSFSRISEDVNAALGQESAYNQRLALNAMADRLEGLLRELTRSSDKYAVRFRPIAVKWRETIANHVEELRKTVELRQEIDSPYIIGVPLTQQQEIFVGRTDISARIEQLLLDQRRPPLLLYGQRRTGKTSLLNNLGRLLPNAIAPMFVDLQGPASRASDHAGLLYNIARSMVSSAQRQRRLSLPALDRESLAADPFTRFDEWLDEIEQVLEQNTVLLALDEFEALDQALTQERFSETDVLGMLRNLIQHRPQFKILLAGSHTLQEFQRWASYLINAQVVHIGYLKEAEARQLIERPVKDFTLRYEPDARQRVLDLTRGHPCLVQLLCAELVALKNEQEPAIRRLARLSDVEEAVPKALESGSMFFSDMENNQVDAGGRAVLRCLAASGEGAMVGAEDLTQSCPDNLNQVLALLKRRELIEEFENGYRFQVELIRRWFAA